MLVLGLFFGMVAGMLPTPAEAYTASNTRPFFRSAATTTFSFSMLPPVTSGMVSLTVGVRGDFDGLDEFATVIINPDAGGGGMTLSPVVLGGAPMCNGSVTPAHEETYLLDASVVASGSILIWVRNSREVSAACSGTRGRNDVRVQLAYEHRSSLGGGCMAGSDCVSAFCVDGVCCDSLCDSACDSCVATLTRGTDGNCAPTTAGTECRAASGVACDVTEACDGTSAECPADVFAPRGTECRAASDHCDLAEVCDGVSGDCPTDVIAAAGTECRSAVGLCDVVESCDGMATDCPEDVVAPAGLECRAAEGDCDVAEACDGVAATCVEDVKAEDGTACDDGLVCNEAEACAAGVCGDGHALECDDGDECTADMCADPDGCSNVPITGCGGAGDAGAVDAGAGDAGAGDASAGDGGAADDAGSTGGDSSDDGGCGCSVPGGSSANGSLPVLLASGALLWWRRRRC